MYNGLDGRLFFDTLGSDELQELQIAIYGPTSAEPIINAGPRRPQARRSQAQSQPEPQTSRPPSQPQSQSQTHTPPRAQVQSRQQQPQTERRPTQSQSSQRVSSRRQSSTVDATNHTDSESRRIDVSTAGSSRRDNVPARSSNINTNTNTASRSSSCSSSIATRSAGAVVLGFTHNPRQRTQVPKQFARKSTSYVSVNWNARNVPQPPQRDTIQPPQKQTPPKPRDERQASSRSTPSISTRSTPTPRVASPSIPPQSTTPPMVTAASTPKSSSPSKIPTPPPRATAQSTPIPTISTQTMPAQTKSTPPLPTPPAPIPPTPTPVSTPSNLIGDETTCGDTDCSTEQSQDSEAHEEPPVTYDEYGLPSNINERFHRWLYGDMTDLQSMAKKSTSDEVKPPPEEPKKMDYCDEVDDYGFKFISQDINLDDPLPIEEILTPSLKIRASSTLMATRDNSDLEPLTNACQSETNHQSSTSQAADSDITVKKRKPRLTITLEVQKTIIDRRPMLRKMKSKPQTIASSIEGPGEQVSSTSLIAPGEDCDDSDDNDMVEIDCCEPTPDVMSAQFSLN